MTRSSIAARADSRSVATAAGWSATALHELGHWTGAKPRLDRDLTGRFGSQDYSREELRAEHNFEEIVGNSPALLKVLRDVEQVAPTDSTVLVFGETGTGKELVARAIHSRSTRNSRALVNVNCSAISRRASL